ncbi:MAG: PCRF domain-containing protein, partial [Clostridia bacterium]|nr:PCRF domain-containing protein [Clostridia bacterium]
MREKLESVAARFAEIEKALAMAPSDMEEYKRLMKERKELAPVCEEYAVYKKAEADLEEAKSIIASGDKEMLPLAEEE